MLYLSWVFLVKPVLEPYQILKELRTASVNVLIQNLIAISGVRRRILQYVQINDVHVHVN